MPTWPVGTGFSSHAGVASKPMLVPIFDASGERPPNEAIGAAVVALADGEVVVVPTDTVYGLAADPRATAALYAVKERPQTVALPVLVADVDQARWLMAANVAAVARRLMDRWWPGGLTVVVERRPGLGLDLGGVGDDTIALRLPAHPVPVALARQCGPLAVTSANRHGSPTPQRAAEVLAHLGSGLALALDAGACRGSASTVVSCLGGEVRILRPGVISSADVFDSLRT